MNAKPEKSESALLLEIVRLKVGIGLLLMAISAGVLILVGTRTMSLDFSAALMMVAGYLMCAGVSILRESL